MAVQSNSSEGLALSGAKISMNASGTKGDLIIDEEGVSAKNIISDSVAGRYMGASTIYVNKSATDAQVEARTHFRSLKDALNSLKYKHLGYPVTISIANTTYYEGDLQLFGLSGAHVDRRV